MRFLVYVALAVAGSGCGGQQRAHEGDTKMAQQTSSMDNLIAPHPGTVTFRTLWNHTERVEKAEGVPDANKFVYFDQQGNTTSDVLHAARRVPIVEVEMSSFDAEGHLVSPDKAVRISIDEYGPGHHFLRHSAGAGGGH